MQLRSQNQTKDVAVVLLAFQPQGHQDGPTVSFSSRQDKKYSSRLMALCVTVKINDRKIIPSQQMCLALGLLDWYPSLIASSLC